MAERTWWRRMFGGKTQPPAIVAPVALPGTSDVAQQFDVAFGPQFAARPTQLGMTGGASMVMPEPSLDPLPSPPCS